MALLDTIAARVRAAGRALLAPTPPPRPRRAEYSSDEARGTYVEPHVRTITTWTPEDIRRAIQMADNGDLLRAADLCEAILGDDRAPAVLNTRINALLGAPLTFEPGRGRARRTNRAIKALEADEDYWTMLPETMIRQHMRWGLLLGLSYGQLVYGEYPEHQRRTLPVLDFWHPQHLRWDTQNRGWYTTIGVNGGTEISVAPNAGKWCFLFPFGPDRPWAHGLWRGMARLWLLKSYAIDDWARYSDAHGAPIRVGLPPAPGQEARNATPNLRRELASDLAEMAGAASIVLPPGFDFKLVEATANTWETFQAQINMANAAMSIMVLGSNLPTEVSGSAGTGATAQHLVRVDYKRSDASTVAEWAHDGMLVHWAYLNFGDRGLAPWPMYDVEPEADKAAKVAVVKVFAEAVTAQAAPGARTVAAVDFDALAEDLDIPLVANAEPPPAPPVVEAPAEAQADAEAVEAASVVLLAATPEARQKRIDEAFARYHETVNMGAAELERWAETECSRLASLDRAPIERNLRLLRKDKADWTIDDAADAMRTVSFVSRMRGAEQGEPARKGCPSRRDISLKNWAFDPGKTAASVTLANVASMDEEAPGDAPFGRWAWASRREGVPQEADTEVERAVYAELRKHFASTNRQGLTKSTADLLRDLLRRGWYQRVLHAPPQALLYRGLAFRTRAEVAQALGVPVEIVDDGNEVVLNRPVDVRNGWSTSWTPRRKVADEFSDDRVWAVTLVAETRANPFTFLSGPGGLYDVRGLSRWHLEKESVGLEPVIVHRVEFDAVGAVALAAGAESPRGELAPAVEGQVYVDRIARKMRTGPAMLRRALDAIEGAESYEEAQTALLALADDPEDPAFLDMMAGAMTLAAAAGIWAVGEEVRDE